MSTRAALDQACDDLAAGKPLDEAGRRLVARVARAFLDTPSRARDAMLRQEAIRQRDRLLIELARDYCGDLQGVKPPRHSRLRLARP